MSRRYTVCMGDRAGPAGEWPADDLAYARGLVRELKAKYPGNAVFVCDMERDGRAIDEDDDEQD